MIIKTIIIKLTFVGLIILLYSCNEISTVDIIKFQHRQDSINHRHKIDSMNLSNTIKVLRDSITFLKETYNKNILSISEKEIQKEQKGKVDANKCKEEKTKTVPPYTVISTTKATDEKFEDYYLLKIRNNSKKTISTIQFVQQEFLSWNAKFFNIQVEIMPGQTKSVKVYNTTKISRIRYSDGTTSD